MIRQRVQPRFTWHAPHAFATFAVLAMATLAGLSGSARAAGPFDSWVMQIAEKELKLEHPNDAAWERWFEGDIGYQRMIERNSPFIELTNTSTTSSIDEFHLTVGDTNFNFGAVSGSSLVKLGRTTPGFTLSSTSASGGDELVVKILNGGLQPGDSVRFQIKLNPDSSYASTYASLFGGSKPDYRTVLFDMNGTNVYGGANQKSALDNAQAYVIADPGGKSTVHQFEDWDVAASQFFNNNLASSCCCTNDPVNIFEPPPMVPEPGSIALALLSLSAGLSSRRRTSRQQVRIAA
jgi:hypothetical protein